VAQVSGKSVAWIPHLHLASTLKLSIRWVESLHVSSYSSVLFSDFLQLVFSGFFLHKQILLWHYIRHSLFIPSRFSQSQAANCFCPFVVELTRSLVESSRDGEFLSVSVFLQCFVMKIANIQKTEIIKQRTPVNPSASIINIIVVLLHIS
jgi:hypothetical protein